MDKEREAFDKWYGIKPKGWFEAIRYNTAWKAWQAAKAQAVSEGFVLVPKVPTQKMLDATINVPIPAVYVDSISGQHKLKVAAYYKAMIEAAQEADND